MLTGIENRFDQVFGDIAWRGRNGNMPTVREAINLLKDNGARARYQKHGYTLHAAPGHSVVAAYDYSVWNDTFDYFMDRNESYIKSNFLIDTFINNDWSVFALADVDGGPYWSRQVDLADEHFVPISDTLPLAALEPYFVELSRNELNSPIIKSGFISTSQGPLVYASSSVLHSDESGVSPGSILVGRQIDQKLVDKISADTKIDFQVTTVSPHIVDQLAGMDIEDLQRDNDNRVQWYLTDTRGRPLIALNIYLGERMFQDRLITSPVLASIGTLLAACCVLLLILQRVLVQPILGIMRHLERIRETGNYGLRLSYRRADELGTLAKECDRLIDNIEKQRDVLKQQSADLHRLSYEDGLTGLGNRRRLDQLLDEHLAMSPKQGLSLAMILCDVDFFKD